MDAKDKKEAMLLVQAQVKDAEALAKATKLEAEKLNKEAESAQIMAAAAASLQDQPSPPATNGYQKGTAAPSYSFGHSTGPPSYGMSKPSMSQTPASNDDGGTYGRSPAGGFDSTVMGSGGNDIPTPSGFDDPYSNPFE